MRPLYFFTLAVVCSLFTATAAFPQIQSPAADFGGGTPDVQTIPTSLLSEARQGLWLVKAKCLSVSPPREFKSQWNIESVFSGPQELAGKTFRGSFSGASSGFVPRVGEEAVWVVQLHEQVVRLRMEPYVWVGSSTRPAYGASFPQAQYHLSEPGAPPGDFSRFDEVISYAQSVERVTKAEPTEQLRQLQLYARSPIPQQSAWAIFTLAQSGVKNAPQLLLGLVTDPQVPGAGLLALDQGLIALGEEGQAQWNGSSVRLALWRRMVTSAQEEPTSLSFLDALSRLVQTEGQAYDYAQRQHKAYTPPLSGEQLFGLLRLGDANTKWTSQARGFSVGIAGQLNQYGLVSRDEVWGYLLPILQSHPDFANPTSLPSLNIRTLNIQLAEGALGSLFYLAPFTETERTTLSGLQQQAKSPRLKRGFDDLLGKKE